MNPIFNKLKALSTPIVWTDEKFAVLCDTREFVHYANLFGDHKETWAAWWSYIERHRLHEEFTGAIPRWLYWIWSWEHFKYPMDKLYLSPAVQEHYAKFRIFYQNKLEADEKKRKTEEEASRQEALKKKEIDAILNDPGRCAYHWGRAEDDLELVDEGKKTFQECKRRLVYSPRATRRANIEPIPVFSKTDPPTCVDVVLQCTNQGSTYSPADVEAVNAGKKKLEQCQRILTSFELPEIVVDEQAKAAWIKAVNANDKQAMQRIGKFYTRKDKPSLDDPVLTLELSRALIKGPYSRRRFVECISKDPSLATAFGLTQPAKEPPCP